MNIPAEILAAIEQEVGEVIAFRRFEVTPGSDHTRCSAELPDGTRVRVWRDSEGWQAEKLT